jgi:hypothetical protein
MYRSIVLGLAFLLMAAAFVGWIHYRSAAYDHWIAQSAAENGIDFYLVKALIYEESWFRPGIRGAAGELGLMQVSMGAARDFSEKKKLPPFQGAQAEHCDRVLVFGTLSGALQGFPGARRLCAAPLQCGRNAGKRLVAGRGAETGTHWHPGGGVLPLVCGPAQNAQLRPPNSAPREKPQFLVLTTRIPAVSGFVGGPAVAALYFSGDLVCSPLWVRGMQYWASDHEKVRARADGIGWAGDASLIV